MTTDTPSDDPVLGPPPSMPDAVWATALTTAFEAEPSAELAALVPADERPDALDDDLLAEAGQGADAGSTDDDLGDDSSLAPEHPDSSPEHGAGDHWSEHANDLFGDDSDASDTDDPTDD
ncbi:hypothetical protein [Herbiconiux daphne]|uniref:Uncharacterized protein n=1 Tax=Herbiconiux daphne TaxID=2970914 RepID=A0ABT2GXF9_9MICO|nr:hypothetical protein [Herbiconiux daphne]MCS5732649.1 hypothetical protein [Herbiconiux daphne]